MSWLLVVESFFDSYLLVFISAVILITLGTASYRKLIVKLLNPIYSIFHASYYKISILNEGKETVKIQKLVSALSPD